MPTLSSTMTEDKNVSWMKFKGDKLRREEIPEAKLKDSNGNNIAPTMPPPSPPMPVATAVEGQRVVATPYAKQLARQYNFELAPIVGTGPMGRIMAKDVESTVRKLTLIASVELASPPLAKVITPFSTPSVVLGTTIPFTIMQGVVIKNMVESFAVPSFRVGYTFTTNSLDPLYKKGVEQEHHLSGIQGPEMA
eukprot:Gb_12576 [translate_table: standard]